MEHSAEQGGAPRGAIKGPNAFMIHNGIRITAVQPDYTEVQMEVTPNSLNPLGMVHGGAYFTMADCCAGTTARTDGRGYVTQGADVQFLRAAGKGTLTARSRLIKRGRRTCIVEVQICDEAGELLFHGTFTMFCVSEP